MSELTKEDLRFVLARLPKDVRELMKLNTLFLGGGFIRETVAGNEVQDIDLFLGEASYAKVFADSLAKGRENAKWFSTDNAVTVLSPPRLPIQIIKRWLFNEASQLIGSFDFTICQACVWYDKAAQEWKSIISDSFYSDLAARRLVYTFPQRIEEAGGSLLRVRKFLARGYNIQADSLAGVVARLASSIDAAKWNGDEQAVAKVISGKLREVDPLAVTDGIEPIDEHEVTF